MSNVVLVILGVVVGMVVAAVVGVSMMRSKMVVAHKSAHSFDETCARIEKVVGEAEGGAFPTKASTWAPS